MEYRRLGSLHVSLVGIGCNNFGWRTDAAGTAAVVDAALDAGINFFDTADCYGAGQSEEFLGAALKNRRNKAIIATKFGMKMGEGKEGARPEYVREALDASLQRLQTDTIDLYQIHLPDPNTPIAETMQALNDAVKAGKVREIGCSNFSVEQMRAAQATRGPQYFVSLQNEYSLLHREPETDVLPECARTGVGFLPYFPLANGLLTGKYRKGEPFPDSSRAKDAFGPKVFTAANLGAGGSPDSHSPSPDATRCWSWRFPGSLPGRRSAASSPGQKLPNRFVRTVPQRPGNSRRRIWPNWTKSWREIHPPCRRQGERPFFAFRAGPRGRSAEEADPRERRSVYFVARSRAIERVPHDGAAHCRELRSDLMGSSCLQIDFDIKCARRGK